MRLRASLELAELQLHQTYLVALSFDFWVCPASTRVWALIKIT